MEPIHSNSPVTARALDYTQEAKRKRDQDQRAAARTENRSNEQHANQVSFSQAAQIKLSEEKSHDVNRVEEVRVATRIKAAEQYSQAISQEIRKGAESRTDDQRLRDSRERADQVKTDAAAKLAAAGSKETKETADAAEQARLSNTAKAFEERTIAAKDLLARTNAAVSTRDVNRRIKETNDVAEKENIASAARHIADNKRLGAATVEHARATKATTEKAHAETVKAVKMYSRLDKPI